MTKGVTGHPKARRHEGTFSSFVPLCEVLLKNMRRGARHQYPLTIKKTWLTKTEKEGVTNEK
jgi:hypothetical protein